MVHRCFTKIGEATYRYEEEEMGKFFGVVAADETCIRPKFKNRRKKKRNSPRRTGIVKLGRSSKIPQQLVFEIYQSNGKVYIKFVRDYEGRAVENLRKSSRTTAKQNREATASGNELLNMWRKHISKDQLIRCLETLRIFRLDSVYTDSSKPNDFGAQEMLRDNDNLSRIRW